MVGNHQVIEHYELCTSLASGLLERFHAVGDEVRRVGQAVHAEIAEARRALAAAYIGPALTPEALAAAEKRTGFRGFTKRDPIAAMEREGTVLAHAVARIRGDERYARRAILVGPEGELTARVNECMELLAPWEEECARFESLDGFLVLLAEGYDTPAWTRSFWESAYWVQWKQGDAICEALDLADFGDDVLPAYRPLEAKRREWREQVTAARQKVQDVHDLVQEHDRAVARIPKLAEIYLDAAAGVLAEFLARADVELLSEWVGDEDRPVLVALHRLAGLQAKARFCGEMGEGVDDFTGSLQDRVRKYRRKTIKFRRPKHYGRHHPDSVLDEKFVAKAPKYHGRSDKVIAQLRRIEAFDAYGSFDLTNDPELWWVVMTGKRPGSLTPSLRGWYDRNQGRTPILRADVAEDIARAVAEAAVAGAAEDDLGYVS